MGKGEVRWRRSTGWERSGVGNRVVGKKEWGGKELGKTEMGWERGNGVGKREWGGKGVGKSKLGVKKGEERVEKRTVPEGWSGGWERGHVVGGREGGKMGCGGDGKGGVWWQSRGVCGGGGG